MEPKRYWWILYEKEWLDYDGSTKVEKVTDVHLFLDIDSMSKEDDKAGYNILN